MEFPRTSLRRFRRGLRRGAIFHNADGYRSYSFSRGGSGTTYSFAQLKVLAAFVLARNPFDFDGGQRRAWPRGIGAIHVFFHLEDLALHIFVYPVVPVGPGMGVDGIPNPQRTLNTLKTNSERGLLVLNFFVDVEETGTGMQSTSAWALHMITSIVSAIEVGPLVEKRE